MARSDPGTQSAPRWSLIGLFVLTLVVRGGVLTLAPHFPARDPDGYRYLAENLLEHGTLGSGHVPTAYRPPLYPLVLTVCVAFGQSGNAAIALLHLALGLATVWLVYRLGQRWGLGHWSLLAAALVACDPILLVQSTLVMTETMATLLAVAALVALTSASERPSPGRAMLAGACLALAALCRATFLPWAVLAALLLPLSTRTWPTRLRVLASFVAGAALVLSPWAVRNQIHFGRPILATTHGGYTLLLGNNPSFYDYLRAGRWGTVWDADEFHQAWRARATRAGPADELRNDRNAYAEAWQSIRREPGTFVYACVVRVGRLWAPLPHQVDPHERAVTRWSRYLVGAWYAIELALCAIGGAALHKERKLGKPWQYTWFWGVLLVVCFTAIHTLYWSNMRMRGPLMPVVALAASVGTARIVAGALWHKSLQKNDLWR